MAKPIYAGTYTNRGGGRFKRVFITIVVLHLIVIGGIVGYNKFKGKDVEPDAHMAAPPPAPLAGAAAPAMPTPALPAPIMTVTSTAESQAVISDAQAFLDAGQLAEAKITLDKLVAQTPDAQAIQMLGNVNMKLLKSPIMIPGKEYYAIVSGDSLSKISKKYNTTVALIKAMNGMETDVIRAGARLQVYKSEFSIRVSKTQNTLDLMDGDKIFKRYSVGTGKFGKTPAVEFTIYDKIVEPPWTRFSDGKQIEYGDPENVLGTRWMAITSVDHPEITGFGIHGTWERDSIGKQSSAGCIRMLNEDVEELFDLVPRKTTVIITE
ncbi:Putative L,D-transpeptidase YkuD [Pontiella desulfatans]|uniref:L,D-transpeptidase YkuD n=1 Tax=Pontiella desulfatans TaxID=2750659 RepID=A0A6C2U2C6_PONDE|nr:L,D-transpeptidase family protein [Pontiella desulfatans]VGO14142.1 Putative L,D-transpeptidase YkuD [Pontiella desulfatans]